MAVARFLTSVDVNWLTELIPSFRLGDDASTWIDPAKLGHLSRQQVVEHADAARENHLGADRFDLRRVGADHQRARCLRRRADNCAVDTK